MPEPDRELDDQAVSRMLTAFVAVLQDMKAKGLGKGHPGRGEIACPSCGTGRLAYSVAGSNGYTMARCSSANCLKWIQ